MHVLLLLLLLLRHFRPRSLIMRLPPQSMLQPPPPHPSTGCVAFDKNFRLSPKVCNEKRTCEKFLHKFLKIFNFCQLFSNFHSLSPLSLSLFTVPSKPQNLTVLDVSATSITMSWHPPKNQNGAIAGYHVFHIHDNQTGVEIVKNSRNAAETLIHFELQSLSKYSCAHAHIVDYGRPF